MQQRFRAVQRLAFAALEEVRARLYPGITERETADQIGGSLAARGVKSCFHRPYAWFGDRTTLRGMTTADAFAPTARTLEPGMPVILDAAPVYDGVCADVALSCSLGDNAVIARARAVLLQLRTTILAGVRAEQNLSDIYRRVDVVARDAGFRSWHTRYPLGTLGHRVTRMRLAALPLPVPSLSLEAIVRLRIGLALARFRGTPIWNGSSLCDRPASPGLWAVEPHIGTEDVGVKFEEILVVTSADAFWLDDDVPHVRENKIADGDHRSIA